MTDRINLIRTQIAKAVEGLNVDVTVSRSPDIDFIDVRAYYHADPVHDFECTWTLDGLRWSEPSVLPAFKDGAYGDIEHEVAVPADAQAFFDQVGKRVGGYGRLSPSEMAILAVLKDVGFDHNDLSGERLRAAVDVIHREIAFRTPERLLETAHDSRREHQTAAATF
ncbi:hypothetical protein GOB57_08395 [Sinorhizobium meliloti]|nr:hypothetical protein [Sinorhizobium meliloti]